MTKITVTVEAITRLTNTKYANPRWRLQVATIDESNVVHLVTYTTEPDAMCAFKVCEPMVGREVTLTLNDRSQIEFIDWDLD